ncbi:hypothetical protein MOQ33_00170 [Escherichia coli]|uniref:hypothetical protein n=1 Tax=Escherichia coli TaxID=562 RepID=UPI002148947F|nr:hypothetical protein [Escherichia coli]MCR1105699.1 hypothetical protein [Escherichia coli]MDT9424270.1 hypothetical protein [Escherichia coli]
MNKYLKAGLSSAENGLLVLESLTENINAVSHPTIPSSVGLDELLALKETLHRDKQVSRQQLAMLSYSLPDAMEGKPLALWTELPSTTGFNEACRVVDKAIAIIGEQLRNASATQVKDLLEQELTRLEENASYVDDFTALTQAHSERFSAIHETLGGLIDHPDVKEDLAIAVQKYEGKLAQLWSPIVDLVAVTQALSALYAVDRKILEQALALQPSGNDGADEEYNVVTAVPSTDINVLMPYFDQAGNLIPTESVAAPKEWDGKTLLTVLGTAVFASRIMRDVVNDYPETAALVKQLLERVESAQADENLDNIGYLAVIARLQNARIVYQRMLVQCVRTVLTYAEAVAELVMSVSETATAVRSEELWDKTQEEIEAADGYTRTDLVQEGYGIYTAESAWETLRRTMEYTVNILKRLVDWLVKSWRNGSAKAAIQQAEANNSQLTRAKDALLTEGTKKRLASLHTVGIQTIAKYAEAGTIWSGAFKGVTDNLGNVAALISSEVKELSNGRELDQDKLAKIREGLALAFEKGNFNKVLLGHDGITIDNLASEIHDYREELKDQFKESTNESIDVDKLIRYNDGCRKFLQGPVTDARNKVSGHELDNLLTMLNSMIRQQASSPENKGLGALKNEIVNARDLAKAAVDVLGIAQWLEVRAKRYINALSTVVDKANSEAAAVSGSLKQESFDLNETVLSSTNYDVCSVAATSLAANRFRNSRDELRRHYNQALEAALQVYNRAVYNRAVIGQHLLGVMPRFTGVFSNYPWTLGLDLQVSNPVALNAFCEKLSRSIELYGAGTADSITQAVALLDSTELCYAVDPNYEGESGNSSALATHMFEYRRLAKEALEPHSDFTTEEQRRGWYATFTDSSPSWEPDNTLQVVTEDVDPSLIWAFASLFCAALNAYIALKYGTDLKVYGWFSEQQNSNNVR